MKKTFELTDPRINPARKIEAIKGQIKKYIKRERSKNLPDGFDFWDFDCSFGNSFEQKKEIHITEITKCIDEAVGHNQETFYLELLSVPRKRTKKPKIEEESRTPENLA
jgi:hypothetical protein